MIQNAKIAGDYILPQLYTQHHGAETHPRGTLGHAFRSHTATEILRNARRWVLGYQSPESKAKFWGSGWDCLLLTPNQWPVRYASIPEDAPKKPSKTQLNAKKPSPETVAAIQWWKEFLESHPGELVSLEQHQEWLNAVKRIREDKLIAELLDCSKKSVWVTAEWADTITGLTVPLKCLIDVLPPEDHPVFGNSIWDTKSTRNASPRSFRRDAQAYAYHIQAAFYLDLWNAASGQSRTDFGHIIQESYPPFEYRTPPPLMTQRFIGLGRVMYQQALSIYCQALQTGVWPTYDVTTKEQPWPLTDCDDWMLSVDAVYGALPEPVETADDEVPTD